MINHLHFKNLLSTWEGINEYFFTQQDKLEAVYKLNGKHGPHIVSYRTFIEIDKCFMDQDFDFGYILGYRVQKWTSLVNNYVDLNKLDILKGNVMTNIRKKQSNFNESMVFDNFHGSGKGCLLNLTCSKRYNEKKHIVSFALRSSEVTRRLLFDLLLVQRMVEYIYGDNAKKIKVELYCGHMYQNAEAFSLYHNHKDIHKLHKEYKIGKDTEWRERCMKVFKFMMNTHRDDIKFRAHKRSSEALWRADGRIQDGGYKSLKAKDLLI